MNALPVAPEQIADKSARKQYFRDLKRWCFDIAYTGVYAHTRQEVFHHFRSRYIDFARMSHDRGYPACVQIQVTVAPLRDISLSEAQHYRDGTPDKLSDKTFFASFASRPWRDFLSEITEVFFQEYGYDWVVFEEPMYRVDVPGEPDPFVELFRQRHPGVALPSTSSDTAPYRLVQELKAESLTDFLQELLKTAKAAGASQAGVMPWFFIPTIENTPQESLNTSCDTGRVTGLDELDFVVVRMQPDNVFANVMRTGDEAQTSPMLYYPEVMAHQLGKPVIAVNNPTDEHTDYPSCPLIPIDFFKRATLASMAAAPSGMTRHWYGQNYESGASHMEFFRSVLRFTNRLGQPRAQVAYVLSHSGARHGAPYTYQQMWRRWWAFGKEMMLEKLYPVHTLWASDLERELAANPQLCLLVLSSAFPLTPEQMSVVEHWLAAGDGRGLVVFAESPQLSADPERPGHVPLEESFPGLYRLLGLPWPAALSDEKGRLLLAMDPNAADSFAESVGLSPDLAPIRRLKAMEGEGGSDDPAARRGPTIAVFPLGPIDAPEGICRFVRGIAKHCGAQAPIVKEAHLSVLWNRTRNNYVVLTNLARTASEAQLRTGGALVWDVVKRRFHRADARLRIPPFQFRLVRLIEAGDPLLDVDGQMCLYGVSLQDGCTQLDVLARGELIIRSTRAPLSILGPEGPAGFASLTRGETWETRVRTQGIGRRLYTITWRAC